VLCVGLFYKGYYVEKSLGDQLKQLRLDRSLTLVELAEYAQVTLATISRMENNKANVTIGTLEKVLDVLGFEISFKRKDLQKRITESAEA
jgi:transcriptional regulator with XRE-family HTH domain